MQIVINGSQIQRLLVLLAIVAGIVYVYSNPEVLEPTMRFLRGLRLVA